MLSSHLKENDGGWAKARKTKPGLFLAKKKKKSDIPNGFNTYLVSSGSLFESLHKDLKQFNEQVIFTTTRN